MTARIARVDDQRWIDPVDPHDYALRILTGDGLVGAALQRHASVAA